MAAGLDRFQQMEGSNRPARTESFGAIARNDDGGAVIAFDDARGGDADNSPVPAFSVDDDAVGIGKRGIPCEAFFNGAQYLLLFFLTVGVEMVEFGGQFAGTGGIFHAKKFDDVASYVHASGSIDPGRDAETNFARGWRTLGGNLRNFQQRFEPGINCAP